MGLFLHSDQQHERVGAMRSRPYHEARPSKSGDSRPVYQCCMFPKGRCYTIGAMLASRRRVLDDLENHSKTPERAIFIKIDPDVRIGTGIPGQ